MARAAARESGGPDWRLLSHRDFGIHASTAGEDFLPQGTQRTAEDGRRALRETGDGGCGRRS